jgi:AraC family transcriptional regulator
MRHRTASDYRQRLIRALRHIQEKLDAALPASELAAVAHFSPYHFSRIFSAMVGESIGQHVRRLRLERAAGALRRSDRTILELALDAGYESHEAFTRAFASHFGMNPSEWRSVAVEPALPAAACRVYYGVDQAVSQFVPLLQENPMMDIRIESLPALQVAAVRHSGSYRTIGPEFERLAAWFGRSGLFGPSTQGVGIYYDDPRETPEEKLRSDACFSLGRSMPADAPDWVRAATTEAGEYAIARFKGPYTRLDEAYQWLFSTWLPTSGREPAEKPILEFYRNSPRDTRPDDLVTDIAIPLKAM